MGSRANRSGWKRPERVKPKKIEASGPPGGPHTPGAKAAAAAKAKKAAKKTSKRGR